MKKTLLSFFTFLVAICVYSQTTKNITTTAGQLETALTTTELTSVTNLTINGTIDVRDFKTMRDKMTSLSV